MYELDAEYICIWSRENTYVDPFKSAIFFLFQKKLLRHSNLQGKNFIRNMV